MPNPPPDHSSPRRPRQAEPDRPGPKKAPAIRPEPEPNRRGQTEPQEAEAVPEVRLNGFHWLG